MFPRSNDDKTRHVIKIHLHYQLLLYLCLKAMSCIFYCSRPVPTRLSVFNKQVGQVRRSCSLISFCSTHQGHDMMQYLLPRAPVAEAHPGHHLLPGKGKQKICKPASSWISPLQGQLHRSSAGSQGTMSWLQWWRAARCFTNKCRKLNKITNTLPWWPQKMQCYEPKATQFPSRQMQGLNDWMCSSIPAPPPQLFSLWNLLPVRQRVCFMP